MRFNPRYVAGTLHEDPKHKSRIIKLLEKIKKSKPGVGKEIQITDAISYLL